MSSKQEGVIDELASHLLRMDAAAEFTVHHFPATF
jgi:hypothetical protein